MNKDLSKYKLKFSVIIGTYNCKKFLKLAIRSVLDQTFKDFELIIVDDGSTDGSEKLIKEFALKDNRVRYFFLKKNSGKDAVPKNFAVRKAKGEYICFLDSDDLWLKDKLFIQNSYLKKNTIMICTSCSYIDESGKKYSSYLMHYFRKSLQKKFFKTGLVSFYMYNPVIFSSVMIKTKIIKKYKLSENPEFVGIIDLELWLRLFVGNKKYITFINNDLVKIRRRSDSLNRDYRKASIRAMHCITKNFIDNKDYGYFYVFITGIALRVFKTILKYSYVKIRKYFLIFIFFIIGFYFLIFQTPLVWHIGNGLIYYDKFEKKDALIILSGNGGSRYINLEYQKRFLDIKNIINNNHYENIIILGREQEIPEVTILSSLIVAEGVNKRNIIEINNYGATYKNILYIDKLLREKNIKSVNFITAPYHTYRSKLLWNKNSKIDLNIIENLDNPLNYKYNKKTLNYEIIKVIIYEKLSRIYNKIMGYLD